MTPQEIRDSLKNHINKTHRKMSKTEYLSLRDLNEIPTYTQEVIDKKITIEECIRKTVGEYRCGNETVVDLKDLNKKFPPLLAGIWNYIINEDDNLKCNKEIVQLTD